MRTPFFNLLLLSAIYIFNYTKNITLLDRDGEMQIDLYMIHFLFMLCIPQRVRESADQCRKLYGTMWVHTVEPPKILSYISHRP